MMTSKNNIVCLNNDKDQRKIKIKIQKKILIIGGKNND